MQGLPFIGLVASVWGCYMRKGPRKPRSGQIQKYSSTCTSNVRGSPQLLFAGLAPFSQTAGFLFRFILEQAQGSPWMTEVKISCMVLDRSLVCLQDRWGEEDAWMMEANIDLVWLGRHFHVSLKRLKNMESSCFKDSENETTLSRLLVSKYFDHLSPNRHTHTEREREREREIK